VDNAGGTVECLGGPECNKIAYNNDAIPIQKRGVYIT